MYSNTFWGTPKHESLGEMTFKDELGGMICIVKFANVKRK
jgi:hypothetical protein